MAQTSEFSVVDIFSYDNLIHAFAGGTGSVVTITTFFPLDTVRTRHICDIWEHIVGAKLILIFDGLLLLIEELSLAK